MKGAELAIQPHQHPEYTFKEGPSSHLPRVPLRGLVLGPSGAGKGVFLCDLLVRIYAGCFERIYVWSPSVDLDHQWDPVKKYSERVLKVDPTKEQTFFSQWNETQVREVIRSHTEVTLLAKKMGNKRLHSIIIVVDDFADMPRVMHSPTNPLAQLFIRGRHAGISTVVSTQKYHAIDPVLRTQATFMICFRLRNGNELKSLVDELSAIYPADVIRALYDEATSEPHSFLYVDLVAKKKEQMFHLRFDGGNLVPDEEAAKPTRSAS